MSPTMSKHMEIPLPYTSGGGIILLTARIVPDNSDKGGTLYFPHDSMGIRGIIGGKVISLTAEIVLNKDGTLYVPRNSNSGLLVRYGGIDSEKGGFVVSLGNYTDRLIGLLHSERFKEPKLFPLEQIDLEQITKGQNVETKQSLTALMDIIHHGFSLDVTQVGGDRLWFAYARNSRIY